MESIERPGIRAVDVPAGRFAALPDMLGWLRRAPVRATLAATILIASLVLGAVAVVDPRTGILVAETPEGPVISSVGVGSEDWLMGARPGMVGWWAEDDGGAHQVITVDVGVHNVGLTLAGEPTPRDDLVDGAVLTLLAIALLMLRLPGGPALLAVGSGIALMPLERQIGLPAALPLLALPPLAALLTTRLGARRQKLFDLGALIVIGALVVGGAALANGAIEPDWEQAWKVPLLVGVGLAVLGGCVAFVARYRELPAGTPSRLVAAAVPLASHSRLEGADEERSRLAVELHNSVLPRVQSSVAALRSEGSVDAASELETLASDLRGAMERRQTVTLEVGGVAEALRSEFESRPGPPVEFFVRGGSNRSPKRVELAAYRVGQAAIDNAVRHSGAERVKVSISCAPGLCELSVADDGVGLDDFAEEEARRRGRIGLAQMRLRAESVGATLDVSSAPSAGTTVRFHWAE